MVYSKKRLAALGLVLALCLTLGACGKNADPAPVTPDAPAAGEEPPSDPTAGTPETPPSDTPAPPETPVSSDYTFAPFDLLEAMGMAVKDESSMLSLTECIVADLDGDGETEFLLVTGADALHPNCYPLVLDLDAGKCVFFREMADAENLLYKGIWKDPETGEVLFKQEHIYPWGSNETWQRWNGETMEEVLCRSSKSSGLGSLFFYRGEEVLEQTYRRVADRLETLYTGREVPGDRAFYTRIDDTLALLSKVTRAAREPAMTAYPSGDFAGQEQYEVGQVLLNGDGTVAEVTAGSILPWETRKQVQSWMPPYQYYYVDTASGQVLESWELPDPFLDDSQYEAGMAKWEARRAELGF